MTPRALARVDWARVVLLAAVVWLGARMLQRAVAVPFNYDEVAEFHAIWQVGEGNVPGRDFHSDHAPLFWYIWSPVMRSLPQAFESLAALRLANLPAAVACFFLLGLLLQSAFDDAISRILAAGALTVTALQPPVLDTFMEFRTDPWTLGLNAAGMLLLFRKQTENRASRAAIAGALFGCAALINPKMLLLSTVGGLAAVLGESDARSALRTAGAMTAGGLVALAGGLGVLAAKGVDLRRFFLFTFKFHAAFTQSSDRFGLAKSLAAVAGGNLWLLGLLAVPTGWLAADLLRGRWREARVPATLSGFLLAELVCVRYPWRHYVSAAVLAGSGATAWLLAGLARRHGARVAGAVLALLFAAAAVREYRGAAPALNDRFLDKHVALGNALLSWSEPGYPVAAQPPFHPVFRPNSTFAFTYSVNRAGTDSEAILGGWPETAETFSRDGLVRQFRERPPRLVLLNPEFCGQNYRAAIGDYLAAEGKNYASRKLGPFTVLARVKS